MAGEAPGKEGLGSLDAGPLSVVGLGRAKGTKGNAFMIPGFMGLRGKRQCLHDSWVHGAKRQKAMPS